MLFINKELEKYVYDELGAIYEPDAMEAKHNLNNDQEKNRKYLGTYFPRSFVESYNIYKQLFSNVMIRNYFSGKTSINILTIGSGTGGDLLGLLQVLNECFAQKDIVIYSFDGNQNALDLQKQLISDFYKFMCPNGNGILVYPYQIAFTCVNDIERSLYQNNVPYIDIMQSFKMCNELYNQSMDKNIFYQLVDMAERRLNFNGILVMEDVTNPNDDGKYNSVVMSDQVRRYFRDHQGSDLKYIIPVCCAKWYNRCTWSNCLSIVEYRVSHRHVRNEPSKVAYKVMIKKPLGQYIYDSIEEGESYQLAPRTYCTRTDYLYNQQEAPDADTKNPYII